MVDIKRIRNVVAKGLSEYVQCTVIRGNQAGEIPAFPYISYNIITPSGTNKGTYEIHEDGTARKSVALTVSIKTHSDNYDEAVSLAFKAREWLDYAGIVLLNDNNIIIQSVGNIADRSNLLTVEYEYSQGFDCFISVTDEIQAEQLGEGEISTASINESTVERISALERVIEAIIANGVDVPEDTDETEYGELINQACKIQYNEGYNQGFNDNSPDAVIAEIEAMIDESGVLE